MKNSAMIEALKIASNQIKFLGVQAEEQMSGMNVNDATDAVHLAFFQIADLLEQAANQKRSRLFKELETFTAGKSLEQHQLEAIWYAKCAICLLVDELEYTLNAASKKMSKYMGASDGFMRDKMPSKAKYADFKNSADFTDMRKIINFVLQKNDACDKTEIARKATQDLAYEALVKYKISTNGYLSNSSFKSTLGKIDQNADSFFDGF